MFLLESENNSKVLEKMRRKHQRELEKMKLKNQLDIEKNKLSNDLKLEKMQSEKSQISTKQEIFKLKNLITKDDLTKKAGRMLKFWAILVTIISTIITIAGGYNDYNKSILTLVAFVSAIIILQFTVFIIASQETRIKQEFFTHNWKCTLLKYSLLMVSIYNNFKFFDSRNTNTVITLFLCISIDLIAVFLVGLAYDQITLNIFKLNTENKSLLYKIFHNITFKYVDKINKRFDENMNQNNNTIEVKEVINNTNNVSNDIINTKENLLPLTVSEDEINSYIKYIENSKDKEGYIPAYKTIAKEINLSRNKASEIKKYLDSIGKTKVDGKRTKLIA